MTAETHQEPQQPVLASPDATPPRLPISAILGILALTWSSSVYSVFGLLAYPRQEWILESVVAALFIIPVLNLLRGGTSLSAAIRLMGGALLVHSFWDALHWPGFSIIQTPIDPRIPQFCPFLDILLGLWLLLRGK